MHQKQSNSREWVKSAAIVFLLILLVLTFFSNTIMNRTLPEVASTSVNSGSITAKVRGTGTVTAVGNNEVKAAQTRYVDSVMVKEGQEVAAGDVLFIMGAGEGEELEAAQDNLDALQFSLKRAEASYPTLFNSASGFGMQNAYQNYIIAKNDYDVLIASRPTEEQIKKANQDLENAENKLLYAENDLANAEAEYQTAYNQAAAIADAKKLAAQGKLSAAEQEYYNALANVQEGDQEYFLPESGIPYDQYLAEQYFCQDEINKADAEFQLAMVPAEQKLASYQSKYELCKADVEYYRAILDALLSSSTDYDIREAYDRMQSALASYYSYSDSFNSQAASYSQQSALNSIDVQEYENKVEKAQAKVDSLSGTGDNVIVAKTHGIISSIEVAAGDRVPKDTIMATIEVPDMGYQLSFSATKDQAKRLKIGDSATISNYYWGNDIIATVSAIKTDPQSPQTKKLIVCDLEGNLTAGSELTVSIGQKSAAYDMIVPNNSIKTDSNGSFVLVLSSKNSPLGNRYFASRVDVEVLASDDVNSAVNGGLNAGDFVITTSSAPIKSGDQVRMADS